MSATLLTQEDARRLIGEVFIYHMPFNRELGLELDKFDADGVQLSFANQDKLVGNRLQGILHGGVIASVLDVAAGLICVGHQLMRLDVLHEEQLRQQLSKMGTIDMRVDYLRPGRGERFTATSTLLRGGNKISVARVELHNQDALHIASATATYIVG